MTKKKQVSVSLSTSGSQNEINDRYSDAREEQDRASNDNPSDEEQEDPEPEPEPEPEQENQSPPNNQVSNQTSNKNKKEEENGEENEDKESKTYEIKHLKGHCTNQAHNELWFQVEWADFPARKDWTWETGERILEDTPLICYEYLRGLIPSQTLYPNKKVRSGFKMDWTGVERERDRKMKEKVEKDKEKKGSDDRVVKKRKGKR